ncbi:hypothetical protein D3C73_1096460 [compost metagenome]
MVDAKHDGGVQIVAAGVSEQHFLRPRRQMSLAIRPTAVHAAAVQHHVNAQLAPGKLFHRRLMQQTKGIVPDGQHVAFLANIPGKTAMAGVVFQQVGHPLGVRQFVDRHHGNFRSSSRLIQCA